MQPHDNRFIQASRLVSLATCQTGDACCKALCNDKGEINEALVVAIVEAEQQLLKAVRDLLKAPEKKA
jgi:hypothetical protein